MEKVGLFIVVIILSYVSGQQQYSSSAARQREETQQVLFPDHDANEELTDGKKNADNRVPLYSPMKCKENELLYPGDQKDDWVCDCLPGYIFHPQSDACYGVYTRGPCADKQYLVLPDKRNIPICTYNTCEEDNRVAFRGRCYSLNTPGPCRFPKLSYVVGVNVTTLQLDCIKQSSNLPSINIQDRFNSGEEDVTEKPHHVDISVLPLPPIIPKCADGTKRAMNGTCISSQEFYVFE